MREGGEGAARDRQLPPLPHATHTLTHTQLLPSPYALYPRRNTWAAACSGAIAPWRTNLNQIRQGRYRCGRVAKEQREIASSDFERQVTDFQMSQETWASIATN